MKMKEEFGIQIHIVTLSLNRNNLYIIVDLNVVIFTS